LKGEIEIKKLIVLTCMLLVAAITIYAQLVDQAWRSLLDKSKGLSTSSSLGGHG